MIRSARPFKGAHAANQKTATVDILIRKVDSLDSETEKVVLYGFVDDGRSLAAGFTLSCIIEWLAGGVSFASEDKTAESYFEELIKRHIDSRSFIVDAAFELTFSDPALGSPVGQGSGFVKFHGGFVN